MLLVKLPTYGIDPFKRIYNQVLDCPQDYPEEALTLKQDPSRRPTYFYEKTKRLFGYATSGSGKFSRDRLYSDTLQKAAYLCGEKVKDATLINEITGLQTKNNRIDHASGSHDDMVIAWMLAVWFLTSTRNLSSYGIYSSLSDVYEFDPDEPNKIPLSPEERYREMEQVNIRNQINELLEVVKETKNEHIATRLIMQIKALDQKLKDGFSKDTHSVDALLNNVKNERAKRIREAMHSRRRDSIYDYS
jgi:hypothetical protein